MPPLGLLLGGTDFTSLFVNLGEGSYPSLAAAQEAGAPTLNYGAFLQNVVDFAIVAFVLFLAVRAMNSLRHKEETAPPAPPKPSEEVLLLREIRDGLKD
jgi:large conductance mechanosensitive channel